MFEVKSEILDSHEALLGVEFEEQTVKGAMKTAAREISRQVNIPGFRRGKAPYDKVVRFVGEMAVMQEAADALIEKYYGDIIEKAGVEPYGPGSLDDLTLSPLYFKIRVPLQPTAELGDYKSIQLPWTEPEISEEEINGVLEQTRQEHAVLTEVERAVKMGDQITVDIFATHDDEDLIHEHDFGIILDEDNPFISEAFVEELLNLNVGDEKTFTATLPESEDDEELSGADAEFTVIVKQVQERTVPELDDALASTAGSFETLDELKADITKRIMDNKRQQAQEAYRSAWIEKLVEQATVAYPPAMIEDTLDDMQRDMEYRLQQQNSQMDLNTILSLQGRTLENFRDELREQAEDRVKNSVVMMIFAREEGIEVTDAELEAQYGDLLKSFSANDDDEGMGNYFINSLRNSLLGQKTMDRIEAIGRGLIDEEETAEEVTETGDVAPEVVESDDAPEAEEETDTEA